MIERTVSRLNSLERKIKHLESLGLVIASSADLLAAHYIRHTLIHSAGVVNRLLPGSLCWQIGDTIALSIEEVHAMGWAARDYSATLLQAILNGVFLAEPSDV